VTATAAVDVGRLRELYDDYSWLLDEGQYEGWLDLFVDDCDYRVVARENFERGLPLATIRCESRAMLADRINAIRNTQFFAPRLVRRFTGPPRMVGEEVVASFLVIETVEQEPTQLHMAGQYRDLVVHDGDRLRFSRKLAIYDSPLVSTSLIYPV
jgi:3-phenylpropionate/cinnamic acid dioxygenase small subunit